MLAKIDKSEVPNYRSAEKSPLRAYAAKTAREFLECSTVGDVCEVVEIPPELVPNGVQRLAEAFRSELFAMDADRDMRKEVKVITRKNKRLFLERVKPKVWDREKGWVE